MEESSRKERTIVEELESYGRTQDLHIVNRDGDQFYIECPECHGTELTTSRTFGCKNCHTQFTLYLEDGYKSLRVLSEIGSVGSYDDVKLINLRGNDYFNHELYGRNDHPHTIEEIKKTYPDAKVIRIGKDLHDGKDAHGHAEYKKFVIIPVR